MAYQYGNLAELKAALDSGELNPETFHVVLDNDCTPGYLWNEDGMSEDECVFDGGFPGVLLEEALTLLGIPWAGA